MSIFKCKMCGGTLDIDEKQTTATCEYCGTEQTLPRLDDERRANLYDRAGHFRRNNEFDKAMAIYENILNEDSTDAEAYWSLVLCHYGIEYVEDPATKRRVPTVNRAQFTSIFEDENYKSALANADMQQKSIYEAEAKAINEIQKGILAISQKEESFDVFICYKETDENGRRTQDSVLANDLYHQLTAEGFKVFFSRITLEDKLGSAYEPYIFAALNSAKVMVVLGTKPAYFNAVWVKNEWSRYLALVKQSKGKKVLIPAYRDMDPYDLPEEFSHLQAQDMNKLGFMQDLIRGIQKLVRDNMPKATTKETTKETVIINGGNTNTAPLLKRVFIYLEDGEWSSATEYCEKVLDQDPENALAYLGKLMAELHVREQDALRDQAEPFDSHNNYQKVLRFADDKLKVALTGYIEYINIRNENIRLERERQAEIARVKAKKRAKRIKKIAVITTPIICAVIAFVIVLNAVIIPNGKYNDAVALMDAGKIVEAYEALIALGGYKDSAEKASSIYNEYIVEKRKAAEAGDYVFFGAYEQDNNTSNGEEAIEWLVLDKKDGKILVISKYALNCRQYNTRYTSDITWETCSLRKWLNDTFINAAFTDAEKSLIPTVTVSADKNPHYSIDPGNATNDKVFLLSITEANRYLSYDSARQCEATAYAKAQGAIVDSYGDCAWWLRSPGSSRGSAAYFYNNGDLCDSGQYVHSIIIAVRPAMWIDLSQ